MTEPKKLLWWSIRLAPLLFLCATSTSLDAKLPETTRSGPQDSRELETFLAPIFKEGMSRWHSPGAVFVWVKDGRILFAKGYGYSNLEEKSAVDPETTVFRLGSVSKLFTATAVMQLVERGRLRLDDDVNRYLGNFQLEENFSQPVTLADLLTHTGGFDDRAIGLAARTPAEVLPLGAYLARRMPPRVLPPGQMYSYSSHGTALAGYIVETVSGLPFGEYVDQKIFRPLEMHHSSFFQSRQSGTELAQGYDYENGGYKPVPYDYFNIRPAVGLDSTAADIAHFMIAHLEGGRYAGARILEESTAREMHLQYFTDDPRLPGRTLGFYERFRNGRRAIGHGGNIRGFGSLLLLLPEERQGFFVSSNLDDPRFDDELVKRIFDRYFPAREKYDPPNPPSDFNRRADFFTGSYRINPYSRTTFEKLATLYWQYRITANRDGTLSVHYPRDFRPASRWVEASPLFFQRLGDEGRAVFRRDGNAGMKLLMGSGALEKLAWYETAGFEVRLVKSLMLVFLSACVVAPVRWFVRRVKNEAPGTFRWAYAAAAAASFLNLVFLIGWVQVARRMDLWEFTYGVPRVIRILLSIPPLTTVLAAAVAFFALRAWTNRQWSILGRSFYTMVAGAALIFVWFQWYWNLLGLRF